MIPHPALQEDRAIGHASAGLEHSIRKPLPGLQILAGSSRRQKKE
jgi:hypothetical protein